MANIFPIDKELIPYTLDVTLSNQTFTFGINYNEKTNRFTADLLKNGTAIIQGEKITYGAPMFDSIQVDNSNNRNTDIFSELLIPLDLSDTQTEVNFDNFYDSVFIYVF